MKNLVHIGDSIDTEEGIENIFSVAILPLDIFDFWERCGQFSDFIAEYFEYNFADRPGCKNLISTVINELVEMCIRDRCMLLSKMANTSLYRRNLCDSAK